MIQDDDLLTSLSPPDDGEVRLVGGEPEHDEVGVGAAQDVVRVGVVVGLRALPPDEVHDLVLALARHVGVRQHHLTKRGHMLVNKQVLPFIPSLQD